MLNIKLTSDEKRKLLAAWNNLLKNNPTFEECVNEIESDSLALLAMDLGKNAHERINNIMGNAITMNVIHNCDKDLEAAYLWHITKAV